MLSEPKDDKRIDTATFAYFRARNKARLYDVVLEEFQKSGISQVCLARRMGKRPEVVNRILSAPGNWEQDTVSDLLYAISGAEMDYCVGHPTNGATRNWTAPEWLHTTSANVVEVAALDTENVFQSKFQAGPDHT
jgi:hypothetical protein